MNDTQRFTLFRKDLLRWFAENRRPLPWRADYTPYRTWIAEVMMQQTQMDRGVQYFLRWMERFPDVAAVAAAHPEEVELLPRRVVLNRRFLEVGLLEEADPEVPEELTAPVELVHVRDGAALREHVYRTWERGLGQG